MAATAGRALLKAEPRGNPFLIVGCFESPATVRASQANAVVAAMICGFKKLQQYSAENW